MSVCVSTSPCLQTLPEVLIRQLTVLGTETDLDHSGCSEIYVGILYLDLASPLTRYDMLLFIAPQPRSTALVNLTNAAHTLETTCRQWSKEPITISSTKRARYLSYLFCPRRISLEVQRTWEHDRDPHPPTDPACYGLHLERQAYIVSLSHRDSIYPMG